MAPRRKKNAESATQSTTNRPPARSTRARNRPRSVTPDISQALPVSAGSNNEPTTLCPAVPHSNTDNSVSPSVVSEETVQQAPAVPQFQMIPGLSLLPRPTGTEGKRILEELIAHRKDIRDTREAIVKSVCDCEGHQKDPRYQSWGIYTPIALPRCAAHCPFCSYSPKLKSAATLRKHIKAQHQGRSPFWGLSVADFRDTRDCFGFHPTTTTLTVLPGNAEQSLEEAIENTRRACGEPLPEQEQTEAPTV